MKVYMSVYRILHCLLAYCLCASFNCYKMLHAAQRFLHGEDADLLTNVLVLIKAFFGQVTLAQVHAELQVLEHDRLVDLLPCSVFFALDDIVEDVQSRLLFTNFKKL